MGNVIRVDSAGKVVGSISHPSKVAADFPVPITNHDVHPDDLTLLSNPLQKLTYDFDTGRLTLDVSDDRPLLSFSDTKILGLVGSNKTLTVTRLTGTQRFLELDTSEGRSLQLDFGVGGDTAVVTIDTSFARRVTIHASGKAYFQGVTEPVIIIVNPNSL